MTVNELFRVLELAIHDGHGDAQVYFDTEARTYNYHLANIGSAYCQEQYDGADGTAVLLYEARQA